MDEDRRIRFMVAPLFFLASLGWGIVRDPQIRLGTVLPGVQLDLKDLPGLLAAIAGGGLALFPLGFVIGTTTYVVLRLIFLSSRLVRGGSGCHEICLSQAALEGVWRAIGMPGSSEPQHELFAGVTFDHDVLLKKHKGFTAGSFADGMRSVLRLPRLQLLVSLSWRVSQQA